MNLKNLKEALFWRFVPFLSWLPELKNGKTLQADVIAGITVALVLVPQSMAYAQLAGLPAYYGLYAAFLPPMLAAIFGSSRQLATGPVAVVSLMTAAALEPLATAGSSFFIAYAVLLAFIVGLFQLILGLLRLGVLVNFLSHPVVVGFTNAAAIIIATSQLNKVFGVSIENAEHHYETVWNIFVAAVDHLHFPTLLMAVLAFSIMIITKKINPRLPNVLFAVLVTTVLAWAIGYQQTADITTAHIQSAQLQSKIQEQAALADIIQQLSDELVTEEHELSEYVSTYGAHSLRAQHSRHTVEDLHLQRERQTNKKQILLKQLQNIEFISVAGAGGQVMFYALEDAFQQEEGVAVWHIRKIDGDQIKMHTGGQVVGNVPAGLPAFKMPAFDWQVILHLFSTAVAIGLIGFMEAISIAKAMAAKTRQRLDANQELIGQGVANIVGSMFQSYPTSGSFSRSAININAGAITGFSAVVTSLIVVITLLWLTPLLYYLPLATLAAVIMMAVMGLINVSAMKHAWHAQKHDGIVSIITFLLTLAFAPHLDKGILIGVGLSLVLYLYRSMKPRVVFLSRNSKGFFRKIEECDIPTCEEIGVLRFEGSLYFANISFFEDKVLEMLADRPKLKFLLVECVSINQIDASGEDMMREIVRRLKAGGIEVLFTRVKTPILQMLAHTGFIQEHGEHYFFRRPEHAIAYMMEQMGPEYAKRCSLNAALRTGQEADA